MSQEPPRLRDQSFVSPVLQVGYPSDWAVLVERAEVDPVYLQMLSIGAREHLERRPWASGAPGLGITTTRTQHATAAAMIEANELEPTGGREGLVSDAFAGHTALWRRGNGEPADWTWVFVVAHGYFHTFKWSSAWRNTQQAAVMGSVRLLNPAEPTLWGTRIES